MALRIKCPVNAYTNKKKAVWKGFEWVRSFFGFSARVPRRGGASWADQGPNLKVGLVLVAALVVSSCATPPTGTDRAPSPHASAYSDEYYCQIGYEEYCYDEEWDWLRAGIQSIGETCWNLEALLNDMLLEQRLVVEGGVWAWGEENDAVTVGCEAVVGSDTISTPYSPDCKIYLRNDGIKDYHIHDGHVSPGKIYYKLRHEVGHVLRPGDDDEYGNTWANYDCFPPV